MRKSRRLLWLNGKPVWHSLCLIAVTPHVWRYFDGFALAGFQLRSSTAPQESRHDGDHGLYAGVGYRRDYGNFQRGLRSAAAAAAVRRVEPDHGRLRGQLPRQAESPGGPKLR